MGGLGIEEATDLFDRRRRAWLAEDVDAYLACFADDLVLSVPGRDEPVRGVGAYRPIVETAYRWAAPVAFDVHHLAVTPDGTVLAEWTIAVRRRDNGADVSWSGMSACGLDEGRITWWREHWDRAQLRR